MARTKDPTAATNKAWASRRRAQAAAGASPIVSAGDFAATPVEMATSDELDSMLSYSDGSELTVMDQSPDDILAGRPPGLNTWEKDYQRQTRLAAEEGMRDLEIPRQALDGIPSIAITSEKEFAWYTTDQGRKYDPSHNAPAGDYQGMTKQVRVNSTHYALRLTPREGTTRAEHVANTIAHEVGHNAHLSKISDSAAVEFSKLSYNGQKCKITSYGTDSTAEHFAEAFKHYARPGKMRERLKDLEPETHAFMQRLWGSPGMWQPKPAYKLNRRWQSPGVLI
jgi:hypothetical protein